MMYSPGEYVNMHIMILYVWWCIRIVLVCSTTYMHNSTIRIAEMYKLYFSQRLNLNMYMTNWGGGQIFQMYRLNTKDSMVFIFSLKVLHGFQYSTAIYLLWFMHTPHDKFTVIYFYMCCNFTAIVLHVLCIVINS